jgi:hypothetical protein
LLATEGHGRTWPHRHAAVGRRDSGRMNLGNRSTISGY